jgi:ribonucleoside-diphosphate reductase alpha chain
MAQDFLTTYKYGWKTSYYQNTYDSKNDEIKDDSEETESLLNEILASDEDDCESCKI